MLHSAVDSHDLEAVSLRSAYHWQWSFQPEKGGICQSFDGGTEYIVGLLDSESPRARHNRDILIVGILFHVNRRDDVSDPLALG